MTKPQISMSATGLYIAYPTTETLKPIYSGYKTLVNGSNTKVGVARSSFADRQRSYARTFQGEIEFVPVIELPVEVLHDVERQLLLSLRARFERVGRAREWFRTDDRLAVIAAIKDVIQTVRRAPVSAASPSTKRPDTGNDRHGPRPPESGR